MGIHSKYFLAASAAKGLLRQAQAVRQQCCAPWFFILPLNFIPPSTCYYGNLAEYNSPSAFRQARNLKENRYFQPGGTSSATSLFTNSKKIPTFAPPCTDRAMQNLTGRRRSSTRTIYLYTIIGNYTVSIYPVFPCDGIPVSPMRRCDLLRMNPQSSFILLCHSMNFQSSSPF